MQLTKGSEIIMLKLTNYANINLLYVSERSKVYEALRESDQKKVILKTPYKELPSAKDIARLKKEYHILKDLDIECVPNVYDLIHKDSSYVLVREYFKEQNLKISIHPQRHTLDLRKKKIRCELSYLK